MRGVNATIGAFQKAKETATATIPIDKTRAAATKDAHLHGARGDEQFDDNDQQIRSITKTDGENDPNAKDPPLASFVGAFERPGRRKYRKVDIDGDEVDESVPTSFQKMAADTAQVRSLTIHYPLFTASPRPYKIQATHSTTKILLAASARSSHSNVSLHPIDSIFSDSTHQEGNSKDIRSGQTPFETWLGFRRKSRSSQQ